ncbi:hypothetical protein GCM10028773_27530 [Spirosoma koreense]
MLGLNQGYVAIAASSVIMVARDPILFGKGDCIDHLHRLVPFGSDAHPFDPARSRKDVEKVFYILHGSGLWFCDPIQ